MADEMYMAPGIEDRTLVAAPLNTVLLSEPTTPSWRTRPADSGEAAV